MRLLFLLYSPFLIAAIFCFLPFLFELLHRHFPNLEHSLYLFVFDVVLCVIPFFVLIVVCGTLFQEHTDDVWMIRMFLHRTATNRADSNLGKDLWLTSTPRLGYQKPMVIVLLNLAAECYKVSAPRFGWFMSEVFQRKLTLCRWFRTSDDHGRSMDRMTFECVVKVV